MAFIVVGQNIKYYALMYNTLLHYRRIFADVIVLHFSSLAYDLA